MNIDDLARQAALWCKKRLETGVRASEALRSKELQPPDIMFARGRLEGLSELELCSRRSAIVLELSDRRRKLLAATQGKDTPIGGRILALDVDAVFLTGLRGAKRTDTSGKTTYPLGTPG